jgi:uncharacterized protein YyaL (SSP411 family)
MLNNVKNDCKETPIAYYNWLNLMQNYTGNYYEIAVSGKDALKKVKELENYYLPNVLLAGSTTESKLPLMESRFMPNETFIYVCVEGACKLPETEVSTVITKLK